MVLYTNRKISTTRAIAIILAISLALGLNTASATITAPAAGDVKPTNQNWQLFILADDHVTTASWNSNAALTAPYSACSLHQTTAISSSNQLTLTLQASNNGKDWVSVAPLVITAATTAQNDIYQFNNPATEYLRVASTVSNTNTLTQTMFMVCR